MAEALVPKSNRYWEDKAAKARDEAEFMLREANKQIMLRISRSYERLARIAAERENNRNTDKSKPS